MTLRIAGIDEAGRGPLAGPVVAASRDQPDGGVATAPPLRARQATRTLPGTVPAGAGMAIWLVAVALTMVLVPSRWIPLPPDVAVAVAVAVLVAVAVAEEVAVGVGVGDGVPDRWSS